MDLNGYGFNGIGSFEEYFAYDVNEYYESIQMGLPALYYSGRDNPPHPETWIIYFLRMALLYSNKVCDLQSSADNADVEAGMSYLKEKEKELLLLLIKKYKNEFTPIEVSKELKVTNKTVINRLAVLSKNGFVIPILVNQRIRSYKLSDFTKEHEKEIAVTSPESKFTPQDIRMIEDYHGLKEEQQKRFMIYLEALKRIESLEEM